MEKYHKIGNFKIKSELECKDTEILKLFKKD